MQLQLLSDAQLAHIKSKYGFDCKTCPTCGGVGTYKLDDATHECDCPTQIRLSKVYYNANIDKRWHCMDFDNFDSNDRDKILPFIDTYLESFESSLRYGMGWNLGGSVSTGKTLILCSTMKELIKRGYDCYFVQGPELLDRFLTSRSNWEDRTFLDTTLRRVDILGLDELQMPQSEAHRAVIAEALEGVIRYRYNNAKPTLITTNLTDNEQVDYYPRVFSLLAGVNEWIRTGEKSDYRAGPFRMRLDTLRRNDEVLPVV